MCIEEMYKGIIKSRYPVFHTANLFCSHRKSSIEKNQTEEAILKRLTSNGRQRWFISFARNEFWLLLTCMNGAVKDVEKYLQEVRFFCPIPILNDTQSAEEVLSSSDEDQ